MEKELSPLTSEISGWSNADADEWQKMAITPFDRAAWIAETHAFVSMPDFFSASNRDKRALIDTRSDLPSRVKIPRARYIHKIIPA